MILSKAVEAFGLFEEIVAVALAQTQAELQAEREEAVRRQHAYERARFRPYGSRYVIEEFPGRSTSP